MKNTLIKIDKKLLQNGLSLFGNRINYVLPFRRLLFNNQIISVKFKTYEDLKAKCKFETVFPEEYRKSNFSEVNPLFKEFEEIIPELNVFLVDNVTLNISSKVILKDSVAYAPKIQDLQNSDFSGGSKNVLFHTGNQLLWQKRSTKKLEKAIFLGGHYYSNWGHWKLEILSEIFVLAKSSFEFSDFTIVLPAKLENSRNHIDLFKAFGLQNPIVYVNESSDLFCKTALLIDSVFNTVPLSKVHQSKTKTNIHYQALKGYFEHMRGFLSNLPQTNTPKKLFLGRRQQTKTINRTYNQEEVFEYFQKFDFEMIYAEDFTFLEQVNLFAQAECIVGEAGSSFFNMLYSQPDQVKVFCWAAYFEEVAPIYARIALPLGIRIKYYYFPTEYINWVDFRSKGSYNLDIQVLDSIFKPFFYDTSNKAL